MIRRALPYAIGFMIFATVHYVVNRWLGTPISGFQATILAVLYFSQYLIALLGISLLWKRNTWWWGLAVMAIQLGTLQRVAYLFIYGILPAMQQGLHADGAPFIAAQFKGRLISGYIVVLVCAILTKAIHGYVESRRLRHALAIRLRDAESDLTALETTRTQLLMSGHFLRNMMVTVANYATRTPGKKAAEASQAFLELLEYVIQATRSSTMLVAASTEWHQLENMLLLARIKYGERSVRIDIGGRLSGQTLPAFSWLTLAENALVHGEVTERQPISVALEKTAAGLSFVCQNTVRPNQSQNLTSSGLGLALLRQRLERTMQGQYVVTKEQGPGHYRVTLTTNSR